MWAVKFLRNLLSFNYLHKLQDEVCSGVGRYVCSQQFFEFPFLTLYIRRNKWSWQGNNRYFTRAPSYISPRLTRGASSSLLVWTAAQDDWAQGYGMAEAAQDAMCLPLITWV